MSAYWEGLFFQLPNHRAVLQTCPTHDMEDEVKMRRTTEGSRAFTETQTPGRVQR